MPTNSENEGPPVYDPSISQNHIFRGAVDTEINPGTVISLDNGTTPAYQTMFDYAVRTKLVGGLVGANLSDEAKEKYEDTVSAPFAEAYLVLRKEDLELRKEENAIRREELALQERRHEKDTQQSLFELRLRKDEIDLRRQYVARNIERSIEELRRNDNAREASDYDIHHSTDYQAGFTHNYYSQARPSFNMHHQSGPQAAGSDWPHTHRPAYPQWHSYNNARGPDDHYYGQSMPPYGNNPTSQGRPYYG